MGKLQQIHMYNKQSTYVRTCDCSVRMQGGRNSKLQPLNPYDSSLECPSDSLRLVLGVNPFCGEFICKECTQLSFR
jgi:hypothetical protein